MVEHWRDLVVVAVVLAVGGQTGRRVPQAFSDNRTRIVTTLRQTSKNRQMRYLPSEIEH